MGFVFISSCSPTLPKNTYLKEKRTSVVKGLTTLPTNTYLKGEVLEDVGACLRIISQWQSLRKSAFVCDVISDSVHSPHIYILCQFCPNLYHRRLRETIIDHTDPLAWTWIWKNWKIILVAREKIFKLSIPLCSYYLKTTLGRRDLNQWQCSNTIAGLHS